MNFFSKVGDLIETITSAGNAIGSQITAGAVSVYGDVTHGGRQYGTTVTLGGGKHSSPITSDTITAVNAASTLVGGSSVMFSGGTSPGTGFTLSYGPSSSSSSGAGATAPQMTGPWKKGFMVAGIVTLACIGAM